MFLTDRDGHACACADSLACLTCNFDGLKKHLENAWQNMAILQIGRATHVAVQTSLRQCSQAPDSSKQKLILSLAPRTFRSVHSIIIYAYVRERV